MKSEAKGRMRDMGCEIKEIENERGGHLFDGLKIEQGGHANMSRLKRVITGLLMAALLVVGIGKVDEALAEYKSTETIAILVQPGTQMSVSISSPSGALSGFDFGTVDINISSQAGVPVVVSNNGNVNAQWMLKAMAESSAWAISTATGPDQVVLQGLFGYTSGPTPTAANYDSVNSTITGVSTTSDADVKFSTGGGTIMPDSGIPGSASRNLWFRIKTPSSTSSSAQQRLRVYVVAGNP